MQTSIAELLKNHWKQHSQNPFTEKVAEKADAYFTYDSSQNNQLGICISEAQKLLNLRLAHNPTSEVRWFQVKYEDALDAFILLLIEEQENILFSQYFSFYAKMSAICNVSILAWEQWER